MTESEWVLAGKLEDLPVEGTARLETESGIIGIYRLAGDKIFAVEDRCPHAYALLSRGVVLPAEESVICPLHGWIVALNTGEVTFPPDCGSVKTFPTRIRAGNIEVNVPIPAP